MKTFLLTVTSLLISLSAVPPTKISPPSPIAPTPSPAQLAWQRLEYYAFVHFGMNTFTDHEWGEGRASADNFNPTALDCRQWARVVKAAGMKGVIITAKHSASLELDFGREIEFNTFLAQEDIALGQRVKKFSLEVWSGGGWETVARQTTIGYKRILRFPAVKTLKLKLNIEAAKACPTITNIEVYNSPSP